MHICTLVNAAANLWWHHFSCLLHVDRLCVLPSKLLVPCIWNESLPSALEVMGNESRITKVKQRRSGLKCKLIVKGCSYTWGTIVISITFTEVLNSPLLLTFSISHFLRNVRVMKYLPQWKRAIEVFVKAFFSAVLFLVTVHNISGALGLVISLYLV